MYNSKKLCRNEITKELKRSSDKKEIVCELRVAVFSKYAFISMRKIKTIINLETKIEKFDHSKKDIQIFYTLHDINILNLCY